MHVITQKRIWEAKEKWPQTANALDAWYRLIKAVRPANFGELKMTFPSVDKVGHQYVFDIGGNNLRLIAQIDYKYSKIYIRYVVDHIEYDLSKWRG